MRIVCGDSLLHCCCTTWRHCLACQAKFLFREVAIVQRQSADIHTALGIQVQHVSLVELHHGVQYERCGCLEGEGQLLIRSCRIGDDVQDALHLSALLEWLYLQGHRKVAGNEAWHDR